MSPLGQRIMSLDIDGSVQRYYNIFLTTDSREEAKESVEAMLIYMKGMQ
jgi:hypothetical protein